jgi:hypothetical protein
MTMRLALLMGCFVAACSDHRTAPVDAATDLAHAPDPCIASGECKPGTWIDVTPPGIDISGACPYGPGSVQRDTARPQDLYTHVQCFGVWKSTDYGRTWSGPINTGSNGAMITDCGGYIAIPANPSAGKPPTIFLTCTGGSGWPGIWVSHNGGVDWQRHSIMDGVGFYSPAIDPYDSSHLLMAAHGVDLLLESEDAGVTWTQATVDPRMIGGSTYGIDFIDMNDPQKTRSTWLWRAQRTGGKFGTWRTEDSGKDWTQVETNEHEAGMTQIYQPDPMGVVYMAGLYSANGDGVFRSDDHGRSWKHVGASTYEKIVFGTSRFVYAMYGGVAGSTVPANLQTFPQSGNGTWQSLPTPPEMAQGPTQAAVTSDGTYNIIVTANYNSGLWRYVEPIQ